MTEPRRWTIYVCDERCGWWSKTAKQGRCGHPYSPVEVVEASAYGEAMNVGANAIAAHMEAIRLRDEARAERDEWHERADLNARELARYREALERIAARVEDDDGCPPSIEQIARTALNETQEQCPRCGSNDPELHPGIGVMGIADPCPDPFHETQEQEG